MPTFKRADQEQMEKAKDLLEAGPEREMGFLKSLFFGRLKLQTLFPYPKEFDADRTNALITRVDEFLKSHVDPDKIDAEEEIPQTVIAGLADLGVLGMTVPKEYGGGGYSHTAYCRVLEHISQHCASTAVVVGAHQSIGLKALLLMGNERQKRTFLPDLAAGRKLAAFCLSEPEVGSDAANIQTTARLSDDGQYWIVNGQKKFATNAAIAGMMTVMVRNVGGDADGKISALIVTPDLEGFEIVSPNRSKCGIRGSWQATLRFNDMRVPADRLLGESGRGLRVALGVLEYGRCTLCAGCVGAAKKALRMAVERANSRTQFGRKLAEFELIKQKIARMAEATFAMESLTYLAAGMVDRRINDSTLPDIMLETAAAKLFCSEGLWRIIDDAIQIWGGEGYMRENGLERMMRDARINRIVEGASEVMTAFVALVGMKGVGEDFEQVLRAGKHPVHNFGRLARFAREQWRDVVMGQEFGNLDPSLEHEGLMVARVANQLARDVSRLLRTYRQEILDRQLLQQRVANAAIELYAASAVLSRLQGNDCKQDVIVGKAFCHRATERALSELHGLFANHDADEMAMAETVLKGT